MGYGDELMASGRARSLSERTGKRVAILDRHGRPRGHPIWRDNLRIAYRLGSDVETIQDCPGFRPYIIGKRADRWIWTTYRPKRGELYLRDNERALAPGGAYVLIEPHVKTKASPNKDWGFDRYQAVVDLLPDVAFVQAGPIGTPLLRGVRGINTSTFREACGVLSGARAYFGPEGGLHHAAAALRIPAVVLFGGFISPEITGYTFQSNLFSAPDGKACGMRIPCRHCRQAWAEIKPADAAAELAAILESDGGEPAGHKNRG